MQNTRTDITLAEEDFAGIDPEAVKCRGCNGPLCGDKTPKLYEGELIFVCHVGEAGSRVLANAAARVRGGAGIARHG